MASHPLLVCWHAAEDAAQAAERRVFQAAMCFMEGNGPAPSQTEWAHSKQLRKAANELFQQAMADVSPSSADLPHLPHESDSPKRSEQ